MSFMSNLKTTLDENSFSVTENGALGFSTSGKSLLDINFAVTSFRNKSDKAIEDAFAKAFYEDKLLALKWLFFARDREEGIGERRLFRVALKWLAVEQPKIAKAVFNLAPYYGRYDDMWCLLDTELKDEVIDLVNDLLDHDCTNKVLRKPISLLGKWLPSSNASSKETKRLAKIIYTGLGMTERQYRKMLSELRKYLNVIEVKMSAKEWSEIDYNAVPSRANLIYNGAFLRNDEERRRAYLAALERGDKDVKINGSVNFPHDIVHRYMSSGGWSRTLKSLDTTLEQLWKALPDFVNGQGNTICVADGSGSMTTTIGGTNVSALSVANALAIYFAEHSNGEFKDNYITFSSRPRLVDFSNAKTLREKISIALRHNEVADTNIEAVFDLLLKTAVSKKLSQEEIPTNVLILSDMEFNSCVTCNGSGYRSMRKTLFREIEQKWNNAGYKMPRIVFWNICSRTGTLSVNQHENFPVALVSGFSPAICKMVLSGKLDPFECLVEQLNSERYQIVEEAVKEVI